MFLSLWSSASVCLSWVAQHHFNSIFNVFYPMWLHWWCMLNSTICAYCQYGLMLSAGNQLPADASNQGTVITPASLHTHSWRISVDLCSHTHTEVKYTADRNNSLGPQSARWEAISTARWTFYFETLGSFSLRQCLISYVKHILYLPQHLFALSVCCQRVFSVRKDRDTFAPYCFLI